MGKEPESSYRLLQSPGRGGVAVVSSGAAEEAEVTGPGGTQGVKVTSRLGLAQTDTRHCHLLTQSPGGRGGHDKFGQVDEGVHRSFMEQE